MYAIRSYYGFGRKGLYLSASDADSGGEEGGYFLHTRSHARKALMQGGFKAAEADAVLEYLDITEVV